MPFGADAGELGRVIVYKKNGSNQRLGGSCFDLHVDGGGGLLGQCVTGQCDRYDATPNDGKLDFPDLAPGDYILHEYRAPAGYRVSKRAFSLDAGETLRIVVVDQTGGATVIVTTVDDVNGVLLNNVCYGAYIDLGGGQFGEHLAGGSDGYDGVDGKTSITGLPPGNYLLNQGCVPSGYLRADNPQFQVPANAGTVRLTVRNRRVVAADTLLVTKTDTTGNILTSACFFVFRDAGGGRFGAFLDSACDFSDGSGDGKTLFTNVPAGAYFLLEYRAPNGFRVGKAVAFSKTAGRQRKVTVTNSPGGAVLQVKSTDADSGDPLTGACYQVHRDAGGGQAGNLVTLGCDEFDGSNDGTWTALGLPTGTYVLIQTMSPTGYVRSGNRTFTVVSGQTTKVVNIKQRQPTLGIAAAEAPSATPTETAAPEPTAAATATPDPSPTATPETTPTTEPTATPSPEPTASAETTPDPSPTEAPAEEPPPTEPAAPDASPEAPTT